MYTHTSIYVYIHINICVYIYTHINILQLFELRFRGFKGLPKIILQCQRLNIFWIGECLILGLIFNGEI